MFKRTRRKIVASIMAILIFVFAAILALIYGSSYYETMNRNREMLESHAEFFSLTDISDNYKENELGPDIGNLAKGEPKPGMSGKKDFRDKDEYRLSSFYSVVVSQDGSMLVAENGNEIYSNEELLELAGEVNVKTDNIGTIGSLMYYKADKGGYTLVAFLDNSLNQKSMSALLKYTLYVGILAIVVFFFLSVYLARMIIRPLEENHIKQKQFISDAGHELKTPISVVSANAELLAREIGENQWLANIQYENERMGALVTQLLDLARMENVTPQMEIVDFSHLVSGETLPFESVIYENGMVFHCEIQNKILVHGNAMQLKQITAILLDNAVKHSTAGGEILLTLKKEHGRAVLSVINDGDEIPAEQCKHLFERFYRMDEARNGEDKHYGLGLAIARAIAVGHRGKIEVKCHDGKVQFIISLPAEK